MGPSAQEIRPFLEFLKKKDLKFTSQRELIMNAVFSGHRHFTADQLFDEVRKKDHTISRATVYRTLALLVEANLLDANDFSLGQAYYERKFGYEHHDHLVCNGCGKIIEFENNPIEKLQDAEARRHQFKIVYHSLKLFGFCKNCT